METETTTDITVCAEHVRDIRRYLAEIESEDARLDMIASGPSGWALTPEWQGSYARRHKLMTKLWGYIEVVFDADRISRAEL